MVNDRGSAKKSTSHSIAALGLDVARHKQLSDHSGMLSVRLQFRPSFVSASAHLMLWPARVRTPTRRWKRRLNSSQQALGSTLRSSTVVLAL